MSIRPDTWSSDLPFDERSVSTTVGYALTLGVTTLLITGLLLGSAGFVEDQRERAIRTELEVIGQQIAADVEAASRFKQAGDDDFTIQRDLPDSVAGSTYTVEIVVDDPGGNPPEDTYVRLTSTDPSVTVEVDMSLQTDIVASSFEGGNLVVTYNTELEVSDE